MTNFIARPFFSALCPALLLCSSALSLSLSPSPIPIGLSSFALAVSPCIFCSDILVCKSPSRWHIRETKKSDIIRCDNVSCGCRKSCTYAWLERERERETSDGKLSRKGEVTIKEFSYPPKKLYGECSSDCRGNRPNCSIWHSSAFNGLPNWSRILTLLVLERNLPVYRHPLRSQTIWAAEDQKLRNNGVILRNLF